MNDPRTFPNDSMDPRPVLDGETLWRCLGDVGMVVLGSAGLAFAVLSSTSAPISGATRSARLEWQARQAEMQQVIRESALEEKGNSEERNVSR